MPMSNPTNEPAIALQIISWISQVAKKNSTPVIPGVYISAHDKFPLGDLFHRNSNKDGSMPCQEIQ